MIVQYMNINHAVGDIPVSGFKMLNTAIRSSVRWIRLLSFCHLSDMLRFISRCHWDIVVGVCSVPPARIAEVPGW